MTIKLRNFYFVLVLMTLSGALCADSTVPSQPVSPEWIELMQSMPPGARYLELKVLLKVAEGIDDQFLAAMSNARGVQNGQSVAVSSDTLARPLAQIAIPEFMIADTYSLVSSIKTSEGVVRAEIQKLETQYPNIIDRVDQEQLLIESILLRTSIADMAETLGFYKDASLDEYRDMTEGLYADMEFAVFEKQLLAQTDTATQQLDYKLDMYQRQVDADEPGDIVRQRRRAIEQMNEGSRSEMRQQASARTKFLIGFIGAMVVASAVAY